MRHIIALVITLLLSASMLFADAVSEPRQSTTATTPAEAELGRQTAEQIEKEYKLIKDDVAIARLNAIAADIAPSTQRPDVTYTCKILDDGSINAMAIPGGTIYVTKGLLNAVESDHELAGVLAHEIAHNSLYHSKRMIERQRTGSIAQLLMVVASIYADGKSNTSGTNNGVSPMQMLTISEIVKQAITNGYSIDLETEADKNAVSYLAKGGKYDPVGLYSVLLGFRQMERRSAKIDLGYIKNHPDPQDRMKVLEKDLTAMHIPINLWNVVNYRASVQQESGKSGYLLKLGSVNLLTFDAPQDGVDAGVRATATAAAINAQLTKREAEIQRFDIRYYLDADVGRASIKFRNTTVITLTVDDVAPNGAASLDALATSVKQSIQNSLFNERLARGM